MSGSLRFVSFSVRWHSKPDYYYCQLSQETQLGQALFALERTGINRGVVDWNFRELGASYHRLYYNFESGSSIRTGNQIVSLSPQNVVFVPAGTPFDARTTGPSRHCYIEFTQTPFSQQLTAVRELEAEPFYPKLFKKLHQAISLENESSAVCLALAILHLAAVDLDMHCHALPEELCRVLASIPKNGYRDNNDSLAGQLGYGPDRFAHWFKSYMNVSPARYIRQAQIAEAARLLRASEKSIEQIAEECGFPNRFYLSRVFTRTKGMGPSEYRRKGADAMPGHKEAASISPGQKDGFVPETTSPTSWECLSLAACMNRRWHGPEGWFGDNPLNFNGGRRSILGVPFHLPESRQGNQAVLLRSRRIAKSNGNALPSQISVGVGKKAAAIYILHACGWVKESEYLADYIFNFEDGTCEVVSILAAENRKGKMEKPDSKAAVADWFTSHPPLRNSHCAPYIVTSAAAAHEAVLYVFKWTNPRPRSIVRDVTLRGVSTTSVPLAILGISLLLTKKSGTPKKPEGRRKYRQPLKG